MTDKMIRWKSKVLAIANSTLRFEHHFDCDAFDEDGAKCTCAAGPANEVLDGIAAGLKVGLPDVNEDDLCDGDIDVSALHDRPCPKCGVTDDEPCKFLKP